MAVFPTRVNGCILLINEFLVRINEKKDSADYGQRRNECK